MAASNTLNKSCELNITPALKRKRQFDKFEHEQQNALKTADATTSCFTNAAFSSTPKKILARRRIHLKTNKENAAIFPHVGLEVKSIAEIVEHNEKNNISLNPYEVLRKPPKKKKRHTEEKACFENPALNLELPEKQLNPYEVVREITPHKSSNCFSNQALNLKVQDTSVICNPFEVQREIQNDDLAEMPSKSYINPVLLNPFDVSTKAAKKLDILSPKPCKLKLGLPFVPTVSCRIDFRDISMSKLTPSKLLAEKLVFSPVSKAKVSLGSIGEETTMDIGKELDRYQLELENSINEAKLRKNCEIEEILLSPAETSYHIQIVDIEKKSKFTQKLCGISEDSENEEITREATKRTEDRTEIRVQKDEIIQKVENMMADTNPFRFDLEIQYQSTETAEVIEMKDLDEIYQCTADDQEDEDSFDFKTPAPFVRAYTKPDAPPTKLTVSKESLESNKSDKSGESDNNPNKKSVNVKNIIRKSIRKLMHPHQHDQQQQRPIENDQEEKSEHAKHNGLINNIRQSFRRKTNKNVEEEPVSKECEISIIDSTERTMKLKTDELQTEYVFNEKKHNLRSSIRKSTREVRNQFMKSVFHKKHEEYDFNK